MSHEIFNLAQLILFHCSNNDLQMARGEIEDQCQRINILDTTVLVLNRVLILSFHDTQNQNMQHP